MRIQCLMGLTLTTVLACGGETLTSTADGGGGPVTIGASGEIGKACTLQVENNPNDRGASEQEVSIEGPNSPQCGGGVCLANHFRGRVTCPYGNQATGAANDAPCKTTSGSNVDVPVQAQCADRTAAKAVYCSCRCANAAGRTDDGNAYCACPGGFTCTQLVTSIGAKDDDVSGAYCIKANTAYDPAVACAETCDPTTHPCP